MVFVPDDMTGFRWRRSALFLPASNARAIEKAKMLDADCLIFDLEDSVADAARQHALDNLREKVAGTDFGEAERVVRLPEADSAMFEDALAAALAIEPDALLLPKVEGAAAINDLSARLEGIALWAMIETPRGLLALEDIARANGLEALVVGPNDLAKATGVKPAKGRAALVPWLMQVVLVARAHGLVVLDGVYNAFRDGEGLRIECEQAAAMGFDGKTLIHPDQIAIANDAFGPQADEIARAQEIVSAFASPQAADKGAIQIAGEMVERLHLESAKRLLAANRLLIGG